MVNINTINKLERHGIGPNVDKLEYYIALLKFSRQLGNNIATSKEIEDLEILLDNLKPVSEISKHSICSEDTIIRELDDKEDQLFVPCEYIGYENTKQKNIKDFNSIIGALGSDIYAFALPLGIKIRIVYSYGKLCGVSVINNGEKGKDITYLFSGYIKDYVSEIKDIECLELKAIVNKRNDDLEVIKYLINESSYTLKDFKVYIFDVRATDEKINELDYMSLYDYMININFNTDEYNSLDYITVAVIHKLSAEDLYNAIYQLRDYFIDKGEIDIKDLIVVRNDNRTETDYLSLDINNIDTRIYSSVVEKVTWENDSKYMRPTLHIKPIKILGDKIVRTIKLTNIKDLMHIEVGKDANFKVINNKLKLYNKNQ